MYNFVYSRGNLWFARMINRRRYGCRHRTEERHSGSFGWYAGQLFIGMLLNEIVQLEHM